MMNSKKVTIVIFIIILLLVLGTFASAKIKEINLFDNQCNNFVNERKGTICASYTDAGSTFNEYDSFGNVISQVFTDYYKNYLTNPSFEYSSGDAARFWDFYGDATSGYSRDVAHSGDTSLKFSRLSNAGNTWSGVVSGNLYLKPLTNYTLSAFIKGTNVNDFKLTIQCYNSNGQNTAYIHNPSNEYTSGTFDWEQHTLNFSTKADLTYCRAIAAFTPSGKANKVYVDDISLEESEHFGNFSFDNTFIVDYSYNSLNEFKKIINPEGEAVTYSVGDNNLVNTVSINNMLNNGGFEDYTRSNHAVYWEGGYSVDSQKNSGARSLEVNNAVASQEVPIRTNQEYLFEGQVMVSTNGANMHFNWLDDAHNLISTSDLIVQLSSNFEKQTKLLKGPIGARYLKLVLDCYGSCYADDFSLKSVGAIGSSLSLDYYLNGKFKSINYPNNIRSDYTYNTRDLVSEIKTTKGSSVYFDESYDYDSSGNVLKITDKTRAKSTILSYDFLDRLINVSQSGYYIGSGWDSLNFNYDLLGNILNAVISGGSLGAPQNSAYSYYPNSDKVKDLNGTSYTYTNFGAIKSKTDNIGITTYNYDESQRLTSINLPSGNNVSYSYDALNYITRKTVQNSENSSVEIYVYDISGKMIYLYSFEDTNNNVTNPNSCAITNWNDAGRHFVIRNNAADVAIIDDNGNMKLAGSANEQLPVINTGVRSFNITSNGITEAAITNSGNLSVLGKIYNNQASITSSPDRDFVIKNNGEIIFMITAKGDVYTKGCVSGSQNIPPPPVNKCGNNQIDSGEDCDGSDLNGGSCVTQGFAGGSLSCSSSCSYDTSSCLSSVCNNGVVEGSEDCDGSDLNGATCVTQGFAGGSLSCSSSCSYDTSSCLSSVCNNGVVEGGEDCDGSHLNGATCGSLGFSGGSLSCSSSCSYDTSSCTSNPPCGNNQIDPGEECDDGNTISGDGCDSTCHTEITATKDCINSNYCKVSVCVPKADGTPQHPLFVAKRINISMKLGPGTWTIKTDAIKNNDDGLVEGIDQFTQMIDGVWQYNSLPVYIYINNTDAPNWLVKPDYYVYEGGNSFQRIPNVVVNPSSNRTVSTITDTQDGKSRGWCAVAEATKQ